MNTLEFVKKQGVTINRYRSVANLEKMTEEILTLQVEDGSQEQLDTMFALKAISKRLKRLGGNWEKAKEASENLDDRLRATMKVQAQKAGEKEWEKAAPELRKLKLLDRPAYGSVVWASVPNKHKRVVGTLEFTSDGFLAIEGRKTWRLGKVGRKYDLDDRGLRERQVIELIKQCYIKPFE